jgi:hypothetical protein
MKHFTLAAFSTERRIAAVVLFRGSQLESTRHRHLPPDDSKASDTVREFARRTLEHHDPEFVAISRPSTKKTGNRIHSSCEAIKEIASGLGIPVVEVDDMTLMCAYGHPPLTRKEYVRRVGRAIWPTLQDAKATKAAVDAALTGLYVQTERLFSIHSEQQ